VQVVGRLEGPGAAVDEGALDQVLGLDRSVQHGVHIWLFVADHPTGCIAFAHGVLTASIHHPSA